MAKSEQFFPFIDNDQHRDLLQAAGYYSVKDIMQNSADEFANKMDPLPADQAAKIYQTSRDLSATLEQLARTVQLSNDPVINQLPGFGSTDTASQGYEKARSILGSNNVFENFFPPPGTAHYADPASIQSLFSPGRYLAVLYEHTTKVNPQINTRRPDLKSLQLNNRTMLTQLPALNILKDVLVQLSGKKEFELYPLLTDAFYPQTLPYDDDQTKLQLALESRNLTLTQLWWQFDPDNILTEDHLLATMAQLKLTPKYHQKNRFFEAYDYQPGQVTDLYGVDNISELADLDAFARQSGITADKAEEIGGSLSVQSCLQDEDPTGKEETGQQKTTLDNKSGGEKKTGSVKNWRSNSQCLAIADYFIRLSSRTNLSINDLDILFSLVGKQTDVVPLTAFVVCEYLRLNQKYGLTASEFSVLMGNVNPPVSQGEAPYYDQHFIAPQTGQSLPLNGNTRISFDLKKKDDLRAQLSAVLGITEEECATLYDSHLRKGNETDIVLTSPIMSRFCFYVRSPLLLGVSRTVAGKLCQYRSTDVNLNRPQNTLHTLLAFRAIEDTLAWAKAEQCSPEQIAIMLSPQATASDIAFIKQVQNRIEGRDKTLMTLAQFLAPVFQISPDIMNALLGWLNRASTSLSATAETSELTPDQLYRLSQFVLITRWGRLNAKEIQLLSDSSITGAHFSSPPQFRLLQTIARLNHLKKRVKVPPSQVIDYLLNLPAGPIDTATLVTFEGAAKGNINAALRGLEVSLGLEPSDPPPQKTLMALLWLSERLALATQLGISNNTLEILYTLLQFTHKEDHIVNSSPALKQVADALFTKKSNIAGED
ncbi:MAG: Tc toxin subunit A [Rouxiella aceris]|uniref:Tc toxin subunit A n=1 Tax=Rouxiella aceris TaxID=2703884 RepID=UPI00284CD46E|nr:Tc toxin subunit A [Rouxiella aceris]MDR3430365.1 Tc toxin subunit A [Rouxiella aceris]